MSAAVTMTERLADDDGRLANEQQLMPLTSRARSRISSKTVFDNEMYNRYKIRFKQYFKPRYTQQLSRTVTFTKKKRIQSRRAGSLTMGEKATTNKTLGR